jgi:quercetin dioxygenase-like cupin family protein
MTSEQGPYLNTREDVAIRFLGIPTLMRSTGESTNGSFGLMEHWEMPPGFASPYHMHHLEDEAFYVLEGEMAFVCDGKWMKGGPGAYIFGPREIPPQTGSLSCQWRSLFYRGRQNPLVAC